MIRPVDEQDINAPIISANSLQQPKVVIVEPDERAQKSDRTLSANLVWNSFRRVAWLAFPIAICLAFNGAMIGWLVFVPKHSASAFLRVSSQQKPLVFATADQVGSRPNFDLYKNTQQQLMVTPYVLNAALRDPAVAALRPVIEQKDAIGWLQKRTSVDFPANGEIMQVKFTSENAADCTVIVNAIVNAYLEEVVNYERNERLRRLDSLERVHSDAESKVRAKQGELKSLAAALGTGDSASLTVAQKSALEQFGHMQERLGTLQFELMEAKGELSIAEEMQKRRVEAAESTGGDTEVAIQPKPTPQEPETIRRLKRDVADFQSRIDILKLSHGDSHPAVKTLKMQLDSKQKLLAQERKEFESVVVKNQQAEEQYAQQLAGSPLQAGSQGKLDYDRMMLQKRVQVLTTQESILQTKVDELEKETRQLGKSSIDVELMRSEILAAEEVLQRVGEEMERTSIELKTASRVELVNAADRTESPGQIKRYGMAGLLCLVGFIGPIALAVGWDIQSRKVDDPDAVNERLELNTLGMLPLVSQQVLNGKEESASRRLRRQRIQLNESILGMAAMIWQLFRVENRRVIMVSSAVAGEGKSTVSVQLAECLARSNRKVLLVDFDLRSPSIASYLGIEANPGVSDVLNGEQHWKEVVQQVGDLHVLTSGDVTFGLSDFERNGDLARFFTELKQDFDLIVVDSPPVLPVVDARLIGTYCDGVVMTLIRDVSRVPLACAACELLNQYGVSVLGSIFIGVRGGAGQRYDRYAYYGYGQGERALAETSSRQISVPR